MSGRTGIHILSRPLGTFRDLDSREQSNQLQRFIESRGDTSSRDANPFGAEMVVNDRMGGQQISEAPEVTACTRPSGQPWRGA